MPTFTYEAADSGGVVIKGSLEAEDKTATAQRLQEMGYFPISISGQTGAGEKKALAAKKASGRKLAGFTNELARLLEAGLALDRSLQVLAHVEDNAQFRAVIRDLHEGIRAGEALSECLARHPRIFNDVYVSTVRAGEAAAAIETVLGRLSKFMEETERMKDEMRSALIYPALLAFAGGSAVLMMILFVIPRFSEVFAQMGGVMPLPTRILLGTSDLLRAYWWAPAAALALAYMLIKKAVSTSGGRYYLDSLALRAPLIGPVITKSCISRFSRTLGTLLQGGLPIVEALRIAESTAGNTVIRAELKPLIEGVRGGRGITAPLKEVKSLPPLALHMLTVGEETGRLDEMLLRLSEDYDREISTAIKRMLALLEPTIILLMAVVVGFMVISLLLAIFGMNDIPA